jgi:hypothetical protein
LYIFCICFLFIGGCNETNLRSLQFVWKNFWKWKRYMYLSLIPFDLILFFYQNHKKIKVDIGNERGIYDISTISLIQFDLILFFIRIIKRLKSMSIIVIFWKYVVLFSCHVHTVRSYLLRCYLKALNWHFKPCWKLTYI